MFVCLFVSCFTYLEAGAKTRPINQSSDSAPCTVTLLKREACVFTTHRGVPSSSTVYVDVFPLQLTFRWLNLALSAVASEDRRFPFLFVAESRHVTSYANASDSFPSLCLTSCLLPSPDVFLGCCFHSLTDKSPLFVCLHSLSTTNCC